MNLSTLPQAGLGFFAAKHFLKSDTSLILTCSDEEKAIKSHKQLSFILGENYQDLLYFPSLDTLPYDRVSPNHVIMAERADVLSRLAKHMGSKKILVTNAQNLLIKLPAPNIFTQNSLSLTIKDEMSIDSLATFLVNNGFSRSATAIENGEFAARGEILDLVLNSQGYRINFAWNKIESIRLFETGSQISSGNINSLELSLASEGLLSEENIQTFKNNFLRNFGVNHTKSPIYESIMSGQKFQGYEHLLPLFYDKMALLTDFFEKYEIIQDSLSTQAMTQAELSYNDFYAARIESNKLNPDNFYYALHPSMMINGVEEAKAMLEWTPDQVRGDIEGKDVIPAKAGIYGSRLVGRDDIKRGRDNTINTIHPLEKISVSALLEKKSNFDKLLEVLFEHKNKTPIIFCNSRSAIERIKFILNDNEYSCQEISYLAEAKNNHVNIALSPLFGSFYNDQFLFIAEQDITGDRSAPEGSRSSKKKLQNILTELDNIVENELIVHKDHGIGRFEKIETIKVNEIDHDCLKIIYAGNDILYLPVENINLIKKYGDLDAALDNLGSVSWQKRKARLKNKIRDIASDLVQITAQRLLQRSTPITPDQESYDKFCKAFPYSETEDQLTSISEITEDLKSGKLMDRLIVGDVGFGKTEVAMRAAFLVASDINQSAQIAVISPTTILSKQHYNSFVERFAGFGLNIAHLSRLVKPLEAKKVKEAIENGSANIIIGTHALLAKNIKFKNLKLLVIDEEQHFGVVQKEHLKSLKNGVHILSLSATPIPRTLQMSMVGIKDLSLIATPPIDRLPVRTNVIPFDPVIIRDALMRERFRGGKSFYVCPRIKDIEWVKTKLTEFVPELKYKVAHGQMTPGLIDNIMTEFYDGKFDILLSTTIIESGIDIKGTNTIIIHKADMLGLSQLYQLRGRVGRGKVRGYAYLTLPNDKLINKHSLKRLEILQNIESLGAGFAIASHDMDLRGFGNLVGDEQSGHIREVGLELYQEMLDEAIDALKSQDNKEAKEHHEWSPIINLTLPVFIPSNYIEDSPLRFAIYRRAGALKTRDEVEDFRDEMVDRFGALPEEFSNLLEIVKIKHRCFELKITNLDSGPNGFVMKFNENFDIADMVLGFIAKYPRHAKAKPDNKLVFLQSLDSKNIISKTYDLLDNLAGQNPDSPAS